MTVRENDLLRTITNFQKKKAVIFDMDGLIFDTERLFMEQLAIAMKEHGYTLTREIYCETLGLGGAILQEKMCSYYGEEYPFAQMGEEAEKRVKLVAETVGLTVKPQIPEVLQYLQEKKIPCGVASSTRSDMVKLYLQKAGLFSYFQEIVGGEMVERSKPQPDIFLLACERLGQKPRECVVLEDSENGVRAAAAAGCSVICVPDLKQPSKEVAALADYLVE